MQGVRGLAAQGGHRPLVVVVVSLDQSENCQANNVLLIFIYLSDGFPKWQCATNIYRRYPNVVFNGSESQEVSNGAS